MNALASAVRIKTKMPLIQEAGRTITTNFVYVRHDRPLPKEGDFVLVESETNLGQFPGVVIEVFTVRHGYVARIDLS
jgi:hypothetical protein